MLILDYYKGNQQESKHNFSSEIKSARNSPDIISNLAISTFIQE